MQPVPAHELEQVSGGFVFVSDVNLSFIAAYQKNVSVASALVVQANSISVTQSS
jgi:hypothetical protein